METTQMPKNKNFQIFQHYIASVDVNPVYETLLITNIVFYWKGP